MANRDKECFADIIEIYTDLFRTGCYNALSEICEVNNIDIPVPKKEESINERLVREALAESEKS